MNRTAGARQLEEVPEVDAAARTRALALMLHRDFLGADEDITLLRGEVALPRLGGPWAAGFAR